MCDLNPNASNIERESLYPVRPHPQSLSEGRGELDTDTSKLFSYSISSLIILIRLFRISFAFSSSIPQNISALILYSKNRGELDTDTSKLFYYSISSLIFLICLFRMSFAFSSSIPCNINVLILYSEEKGLEPLIRK